ERVPCGRAATHVLTMPRNHPSSPSIVYWHRHRRELHCFPTRRSSDLRGHASVVFRAEVVEGVHATAGEEGFRRARRVGALQRCVDRKSTCLNSSHVRISYAVFCLNKEKDQ